MTSKTFWLGDEGSRGVCAKILVFSVVMIIVAVAIVIGIYAFKKTVLNDRTGCGYPPFLDEHGMSNWTSEASTIAFGCFPGFFMEEGKEGLQISQCVKDAWMPPPPSCNHLPLHLKCSVNRSGLLGDVYFKQDSKEEAARIHGEIDYDNAIKAEGHLLEVILLSKERCKVMSPNETEITAMKEEDRHTFTVNFVSEKLKAYRRATLHINMIFLDIHTTAKIISVAQDDFTLVMPSEETTDRPHIHSTTTLKPVTPVTEPTSTNVPSSTTNDNDNQATTLNESTTQTPTSPSSVSNMTVAPTRGSRSDFNM